LGVIELIESEIPLDETSLTNFISEVQSFLNKLNVANIEALHKRYGGTITAKETFEFFRSQERITNTKLIIQYLMSFIKELPLEVDTEKEELNPFIQFKSFLKNSNALFKERDVRNAILKEYEIQGFLNDNNLWYYRGRVDVFHKQISQLLNDAKEVNCANYIKLFNAVKIYAKFWFAQRNEKFIYIRKSDYYSYKLSSILINKINSNNEYS